MERIETPVSKTTRFVVFARKHGNVSRHSIGAYDTFTEARDVAALEFDFVGGKYAERSGYEIERVETIRTLVLAS